MSAADPKIPIRTWRVTAYIFAPMLSTMPIPPQAGSQLSFASRLTAKAIDHQNMTIALLPAAAMPPVNMELPPGVELAFLFADTTGPLDAHQAAEAAIGIFEPIIDSLSFELGAAIGLGQCEVLDITAPLNVDDRRELAIFADTPYWTNVRSIEMQSIRGAASGSLPEDVPDYDPRTAAMLRWFYKSLSTNLLHDVFIFLWIALEILVDHSPISVEAPYQARCNHEIRHCPECGTPTDKEVRGPTIRQYLEVAFGVEPETARQLWRMRQMMHGAINFEADKLKDLPRLVQPLRAAVAEGIKRRLGIDTHAPPLISSSGLAINPAVGVEGTRLITVDDLPSLPEQVRMANSPSVDQEDAADGAASAPSPAGSAPE